MNNKLKLEINKLIIEKEEITKAGDEFRKHMNNTIDRLQKEAHK